MSAKEHMTVGTVKGAGSIRMLLPEYIFLPPMQGWRGTRLPRAPKLRAAVSVRLHYNMNGSVPTLPIGDFRLHGLSHLSSRQDEQGHQPPKTDRIVTHYGGHVPGPANGYGSPPNASTSFVVSEVMLILPSGTFGSMSALGLFKPGVPRRITATTTGPEVGPRRLPERRIRLHDRSHRAR